MKILRLRGFVVAFVFAVIVSCALGLVDGPEPVSAQSACTAVSWHKAYVFDGAEAPQKWLRHDRVDFYDDYTEIATMNGVPVTVRGVGYQGAELALVDSLGLQTWLANGCG